MVLIDRTLTSISQSPVARTLTKVALSFSDQICISGARFLTTILLTRFARVEQGYYAASFGFLLIATCVLESLISAPFNLYHERATGVAKKLYHGSVLQMVFWLAAASSLFFFLIWLAFPLIAQFLPQGSVSDTLLTDTSVIDNSDTGGSTAGVGGAWMNGMRGAFLGLALAAPCLVLREFGRRVELARLRVGYSFAIDASAAVLQILLICILIGGNFLTAATAYAAIGISAAIPAIAWMALYYRNRIFDKEDFRKETLRHWDVARWPLFSQIVGLLHLQGTIWIVGLVFGSTAVGIFANCNHLLLIINPLALGACSFVTPLAVKTFHDQGVVAVRKLISGFATAIGMAMLGITLIISLNADWLLTTLFKDPAYFGLGSLMLLLGLNLTLGVVHMISDQGVWAVEQPRWLLHSTLLTAGTTMLLAVPLTYQWGLHGAAVSMLIGRSIGLSYQLRKFYFSKLHQPV